MGVKAGFLLFSPVPVTEHVNLNIPFNRLKGRYTRNNLRGGKKYTVGNTESRGKSKIYRSFYHFIELQPRKQLGLYN